MEGESLIFLPGAPISLRHIPDIWEAISKESQIVSMGFSADTFPGSTMAGPGGTGCSPGGNQDDEVGEQDPYSGETGDCPQGAHNPLCRLSHP